MDTTLIQPLEIAAAIYCGIIIGMLYGVFGIFRVLAKKSKLLIFIIDFIFVLLSAALTELVIIYTSDGKLYFFILCVITVSAMGYIAFVHNGILLLVKKKK